MFVQSASKCFRRTLPFLNVSYRLSPIWTCEINPTDLGNIPSCASGGSSSSVFVRAFVCTVTPSYTSAFHKFPTARKCCSLEQRSWHFVQPSHQNDGINDGSPWQPHSELWRLRALATRLRQFAWSVRSSWCRVLKLALFRLTTSRKW